MHKIDPACDKKTSIEFGSVLAHFDSKDLIGPLLRFGLDFDLQIKNLMNCLDTATFVSANKLGS